MVHIKWNCYCSTATTFFVIVSSCCLFVQKEKRSNKREKSMNESVTKRTKKTKEDKEDERGQRGQTKTASINNMANTTNENKLTAMAGVHFFVAFSLIKMSNFWSTVLYLRRASTKASFFAFKISCFFWTFNLMASASAFACCCLVCFFVATRRCFFKRCSSFLVAVWSRGVRATGNRFEVLQIVSQQHQTASRAGICYCKFGWQWWWFEVDQ